jgi:hypothetical protein
MALTTVRPQGMGFNTGRRNMVINGAMQVAQRGTSTTSTSDGYHTVDRIYFETNQLDNYAHTMSQSTEAPDGFANSFKIDVTTAESAIAADEFLRVMYRIEAQDCQQLGFGTSSAQKTTLSFYVRSAVTGTYAVSMLQFDGNRIIGGTYTINSADTWERKTITFDGDVSGTINNDNGAGLQLSFMLSSGTDYTSGDNTSWSAYTASKLGYGHTANIAGSTANDWYITGVQLEVGTNASDFEHRSFGEELALCQRYFQTFSYMNGYTHHMFNANDAYGFVQLPGGAMRTTPSASLSDTGSDTMHVAGSSKTISSVSVAASRPDGILHKVVLSTTSTAGHAGHYDNSSTPYILISAEL